MPLVPPSFPPPEQQTFSTFSLCRLSPKFDRLDFLAVSANADQIRHVFGPANGWPSPSITFEENLRDLQRHDQEFADKKAFAYAILSPDGVRYLGCVYIKPIKSKVDNDRRKALYDAQVFFWLTAEGEREGFGFAVQSDLQRWLQDMWPLKSIVFPGRTIAWDAWEQMA